MTIMTPKVPHGHHMGGVVGHATIARLSKQLNYYRLETALDMSIIQL